MLITSKFFSATRHDFLQKEESGVPRHANTAASQTIGDEMEIGKGAITARAMRERIFNDD